MPKIILNSSSELKAILTKKTTNNGFQVTKSIYHTPQAAISNNDICIVVKVIGGYGFDVDYIKEIAPKAISCGVYKIPSPYTCSFLLSDWVEIINKADFAKLVIPLAEVIQEKPKQKQPSKHLQNTEYIKDLVKEIMAENRLPTSGEREILETYEGIGGLAKEGVRGLGILSEFYTPDSLVQKMWGLAYKNGFKSTGKVLEPSCGIGRFFKYHDSSLIDAYEIDPTAYNIAKLLYPKANITLGSFETKFFRGNFHTPNVVGDYDLVIGNPPYEDYKSQYSPKEKASTGAFTFDQYFMLRSLDMLKSGGLLVFIIPSSFIRNELKYNSVKETILSKSKLIEAYRLPNGLFPNTYVGTDIIVLRKN